MRYELPPEQQVLLDHDMNRCALDCMYCDPERVEETTMVHTREELNAMAARMGAKKAELFPTKNPFDIAALYPAIAKDDEATNVFVQAFISALTNGGKR